MSGRRGQGATRFAYRAVQVTLFSGKVVALRAASLS
jgi:hypothetical protein